MIIFSRYPLRRSSKEIMHFDTFFFKALKLTLISELNMVYISSSGSDWCFFFSLSWTSLSCSFSSICSIIPYNDKTDPA